MISDPLAHYSNGAPAQAFCQSSRSSAPEIFIDGPLANQLGLLVKKRDAMLCITTPWMHVGALRGCDSHIVRRWSKIKLSDRLSLSSLAQIGIVVTSLSLPEGSYERAPSPPRTAAISAHELEL